VVRSFTVVASASKLTGWAFVKINHTFFGTDWACIMAEHFVGIGTP
jgi:hypothetical protein